MNEREPCHAPHGPFKLTRRNALKFVRTAGRYGTVSLVCFIINNLLLIGLDALGLPLWASLAASAAMIIVIGFILQSNFTFAVPLKWSAFGRYSVMMLPNVPVAYALLWLLNQQLAFPMYFSAPITTAILVIWNAAGSHWALHRRPRSV